MSKPGYSGSKWRVDESRRVWLTLRCGRSGSGESSLMDAVPGEKHSTWKTQSNVETKSIQRQTEGKCLLIYNQIHMFSLSAHVFYFFPWWKLIDLFTRMHLMHLIRIICQLKFYTLIPVKPRFWPFFGNRWCCFVFSAVVKIKWHIATSVHKEHLQLQCDLYDNISILC